MTLHGVPPHPPQSIHWLGSFPHHPLSLLCPVLARLYFFRNTLFFLHFKASQPTHLLPFSLMFLEGNGTNPSFDGWGRPFRRGVTTPVTCSLNRSFLQFPSSFWTTSLSSFFTVCPDPFPLSFGNAQWGFGSVPIFSFFAYEWGVTGVPNHLVCPIGDGSLTGACLTVAYVPRWLFAVCVPLDPSFGEPSFSHGRDPPPAWSSWTVEQVR